MTLAETTKTETTKTETTKTKTETKPKPKPKPPRRPEAATIRKQAVSEVIKLERETRLSYLELADILECSPESVANWVRRKTVPTYRHCSKIFTAAALHKAGRLDQRETKPETKPEPEPEEPAMPPQITGDAFAQLFLRSLPNRVLLAEVDRRMGLGTDL